MPSSSTMPEAANRWSSRASVIRSGLPSSRRNWHADPLRRIWRAAKPTVDLNHTRDQSRKPMNAYGALQIEAAMRAISSKAGSGSVSRISYCSRHLSRSVSSCCTVVELESIGSQFPYASDLLVNLGAGRMRTEIIPHALHGGNNAIVLGGTTKDWVH